MAKGSLLEEVLFKQNLGGESGLHSSLWRDYPRHRAQDKGFQWGKRVVNLETDQCGFSEHGKQGGK